MHVFLTLAFFATSTPAPKLDLPKIAVESCKRVSEKKRAAALEVARKMYAVEKKFDVPKELRGMSLAAACLESGFNPSAEGDKTKKGRPRAIGVLQLWPWWVKYYGTNRLDPVSSTNSWMKHIVKQLPSVRRRCKPRTKRRLWIQAWVHAIRYPKKSGRCREKPLHLKQLRKIKRALSASRISD